MMEWRSVSYSLRAGALAIALAGCSGLGSAPTAGLDARSIDARDGGTGSHAWLSPAAKDAKGRGVIYWANYYENYVAIFSDKGTNGKEEGEITDGIAGPYALFVDKQRNLYVANLSGGITVYKPGQASPFFSITDVSDPDGLTVDAAGTVYVSNFGSNTITEFPKGKTVPSLTIGGVQPTFLATDENDNLYAVVNGMVLEFAKGSTTGKDLGLDIYEPNALEIDRSGNIIAVDKSASAIDIFLAGKTQPSRQIAVTAGTPVALSLSRSEKELYVSVETGSNYIVQVLAYPNGSTLSNKLTTGADYWPIAVSPDNVLGS
jgi:DNA-binding beta-propeller fold protein YncE